MGVEPTLPAWEAEVLPMNYIRVRKQYNTSKEKIQQKNEGRREMKLIIASNNAHKLEEIKAILADSFDEILSLREAGIGHETIEDGETFAANAEKKAREIMLLSGCCALADDSGLCVDALGGAPGIYSARYAGEHGNDAANRQKLLRELKGEENRAAHFTCAMALVRPDGSEVTAEGYVHGQIAYEEAGVQPHNGAAAARGEKRDQPPSQRAAGAARKDITKTDPRPGIFYYRLRHRMMKISPSIPRCTG